jgi:hypothetical protein
VSARSVNAGSGAPLGDPRALHSWLSAFHGPAYFAGMSSPELLLMGMSDQLAGDTVVTGYLGAFRVGGTPVPIGELVEAQPDEALAATAVMPIENGEGASAVLVHTRDASQELSVAPVTLSSTASPTVGTFSEYASGPGPYVASSAGRNVHVVFNDFGETSYLHGEVPIGATTGGGLSPIITTSPYSVHGVSIAMRSSTEGAILYAVKAGSGRPHPEMFFQRIACE